MLYSISHSVCNLDKTRGYITYFENKYVLYLKIDSKNGISKKIQRSKNDNINFMCMCMYRLLCCEKDHIKVPGLSFLSHIQLNKSTIYEGVSKRNIKKFI